MVRTLHVEDPTLRDNLLWMGATAAAASYVQWACDKPCNVGGLRFSAWNTADGPILHLHAIDSSEPIFFRPPSLVHYLS